MPPSATTCDADHVDRGDGDEKVVRKVHMNWGLLYSANEEEGKKYYTTTQKIHDSHSRSMCRIVLYDQQLPLVFIHLKLF